MTAWMSLFYCERTSEMGWWGEGGGYAEVKSQTESLTVGLWLTHLPSSSEVWVQISVRPAWSSHFDFLTYSKNILG